MMPNQVMEMGDAAEALHDIFDTLHACFVKGEGHAHPVGPAISSRTRNGGRRGVNRKEKKKAIKQAEGDGEGEQSQEQGAKEVIGGEFWSRSVVSDTFGIHLTERTACTLCG